MTRAVLSPADRARIESYPARPASIDHERAACASGEADPDLWHAQDGDMLRSTRTAHAKAWCRACRVRVECLEAALTNSEEYGVWGGLDADERRKLAKQRADLAARVAGQEAAS